MWPFEKRPAVSVEALTVHVQLDALLEETHYMMPRTVVHAHVHLLVPRSLQAVSVEKGFH